MSSTVWIACAIVFVIVWGFIVWEIWTGPLYPDDYDAPYDVNGSKKKKKLPNADDQWYPDQDI